MRILSPHRRSLPICLLLLLLPTAAAKAAPITVNLRVEGSAKTLYEGPVTTDARSFATAATKGQEHPCDYHHNGAGEGFENEGVLSGTPTTALHDAALAAGLSFDAKWFGSKPEGKGNPGDFFVTEVGPDANETSGSFASWGFAVNYLTSNVGGCQIALAPGSEVLWAYNYFNLSHRLSLSGPTTASQGVPFTIKVIDGSTGAPIAGAAVGEDVAGVTTPLSGAPVTDAHGNATITLSALGGQLLKASAPEAVRSNGLSVCVHNGEDGTCGTTLHGVGVKAPPPLVKPPVAEVSGILAGHIYSRRAAPRLLHGVIHLEGGALSDVRISLQRRLGRRCFTFSGTRGRFVRSRCGRSAFFSVGNSLSFSYLLPTRLPAGRYVFDIATAPSAARTAANHVVFRVR